MMGKEVGFSIELSSRFEEWWRYNTVLTGGCFDAEGRQIDFVSAESHVAEVGARLEQRPKGLPAELRLRLATPPCDHIELYLYIIPNTLPTGRVVADYPTFPVALRIDRAGRRLRTEHIDVNQWGGTSRRLVIPSADEEQ